LRRRVVVILGFVSLRFDAYIAVEEQTLRGLTENIFARLANSEYFLFDDFKRDRLEGSNEHRGSLFSHQELASLIPWAMTHDD
jgi:hypothetical protein